jgi:hypothetical protein
VEGYESEVLKGLSKSVEMISFEYTVPEQTDKVIDCINQLEKINPNAMFNYSIGETMIFGSKEWLSAVNMKNRIASKDFTDNGFGDIYVTNKDQNHTVSKSIF